MGAGSFNDNSTSNSSFDRLEMEEDVNVHAQHSILEQVAELKRQPRSAATHSRSDECPGALRSLDLQGYLESNDQTIR
jgi:hypothetical protein